MDWYSLKINMQPNSPIDSVQKENGKFKFTGTVNFRGNYVLLDFWASECGPCRAQHKWLKNIYNKFNKYGFKILSVSGDNDKSRWKNAIIQDSIPWANVSDLKGWKNEAFLLYDIKLIPQNYLINPEGKIIKWRLCNESYADYELGIIYEKYHTGI